MALICFVYTTGVDSLALVMCFAWICSHCNPFSGSCVHWSPFPSEQWLPCVNELWSGVCVPYLQDHSSQVVLVMLCNATVRLCAPTQCCTTAVTESHLVSINFRLSVSGNVFSD